MLSPLFCKLCTFRILQILYDCTQTHNINKLGYCSVGSRLIAPLPKSNSSSTKIFVEIMCFGCISNLNGKSQLKHFIEDMFIPI